MSALLSTNLPFPVRHGKVRDVYDLGEHLLIVATDRISAFDVVMGQGIPGKGRILTQVANFWFGATRDIIPNHLVATEVSAYPAELQPYRDQLEGRSILVRRTRVVPISKEAIVKLGVATLAPVAPLLLTVVPAEELFRRLLKLLV